MNNLPNHAASQQGLGATQRQSTPNPYVVPNQALQAAQIQKANAQAQAPSSQRGLTPGPQVTPQQVQAQQLADGLVQGQLGREQLGAMIQAGDVSPEVAEVAMGMAQQFISQEPTMPQGLGGGF